MYLLLCVIFHLMIGLFLSHLISSLVRLSDLDCIKFLLLKHYVSSKEDFGRPCGLCGLMIS